MRESMLGNPETMMRKLYTGRLLLGIGVVCVTALAGCGGTIVFQGQKAFEVHSSLPPPPTPTPSIPTPRVAITEKKIEIKEKIQFAHDKATILQASYGLMDEITTVLKNNPQIQKVQIQGHASSEGDAAHNMELSDERAKSVMQYLVDHGIAKERLTAKGFGETRPIADNATEAGREKNRRVEFVIVKQVAKSQASSLKPSPSTKAK